MGNIGQSRLIWSWAVPALALAMLGLMIVPAEVWQKPTNDAVYEGFDPNLIYVSAKGDADRPGVVEVSRTSVRLTAPPGSQPTVHLVTTPLSFSATVDIRILRSAKDTGAFRMGIWSPRYGSGYFLDFGPPPNYPITAQAIVDGIIGQTLIGGRVLKHSTLGSYSPGQGHRVTMSLNKSMGIISNRLISEDIPPTLGATVKLVGGPADPRYGDIASRPVPVQGGKLYYFGGLIKLVSGADAYKISAQWLDARQELLGYSSDWRRVQELSGWSRKEFTGLAPTGAAFARLNIGTGNGTQLLFADLFLREAAKPRVNLLPNGDFQNGSDGWAVVRNPTRSVEIRHSRTAPLESFVTMSEVPDLFKGLRFSLTAFTTPGSGLAGAVLEGYKLALPHQRWQAVKVHDSRTTGLVIALVSLGALLLGLRTGPWLRARLERKHGLGVWACFSRWLSRRVRVSGGSPTFGQAGVILSFLVINVLLFNLGSLPFDMTAAKAWAYIAASYGPFELYHLPNIVSLAKVWGGAPYHEGVFPYHPVLAYYFSFIGWMYRAFLNGPGPLQGDTFQLEFLIKSLNLAFVLADAVLIYLILRTLNRPKGSALVAGALFLLNPAIWFSASVWGQTHVVTIFPLLAAIWLAEKRQPLPAWLALASSVLTRPQMLVPASLLGLAFLRKFPRKESLDALSWTVIVVFLVLAPFSLAISPSLPVDILANQIAIQEGGRNELALTMVSLDAYSVWPLLTRLAEGASGLDRFHHQSSDLLVWGFSYQRASMLLVLGVLMVIAFLILQRHGGSTWPGGYLPLVALGTLGFLMLKTGVASSHFAIGLPFLILSRSSLSRAAYYLIVGIWSATTYSSMFSGVGFSILNVPHLAPALHPSNNPVTQFYVTIHSIDWYITVASLANTLLLAFLSISVMIELRQKCPNVGQDATS